MQKVISLIRKDDRKLINAVLIMAKARNAAELGEVAISCRRTSVVFRDNKLF